MYNVNIIVIHISIIPSEDGKKLKDIVILTYGGNGYEVDDR